MIILKKYPSVFPNTIQTKDTTGCVPRPPASTTPGQRHSASGQMITVLQTLGDPLEK